MLKGNRFYSKLIECACHSNWSHVVTIVKNWDGDPDKTFVFESSHDCSPVYDVLTKKEVHDGVRLVDVDAFLESVKTELVVLRTLFTCNTDAMQKATCELAHEVIGRQYEQSTVQLVKSWYDGPGGATTQDLQSIFCSELVAELYMRANLIPRDSPSSEYTPADFAVDGHVDRAVASSGHSLSNYVLVQREDSE